MIFHSSHGEMLKQVQHDKGEYMIHNTKLSIVAAIGKNRELGKNNKLLWHIPEDLEHFKKITLNHPIIMGRKTYESIGRPLPNRANIIVTRYSEYVVPGCYIYNSLEKAIEFAKTLEHPPAGGEIFIIGGGDIFAQSLPQVQKLYLTIVNDSFDADTFFPEYEKEFTKVVSKKDGISDEYTYTFLELERN